MAERRTLKKREHQAKIEATKARKLNEKYMVVCSHMTDQNRIEILRYKMDEYFQTSWGTPWIAETSTWGFPDEEMPNPFSINRTPTVGTDCQKDTTTTSSADTDAIPELPLCFIIDRTSTVQYSEKDST